MAVSKVQPCIKTVQVSALVGACCLSYPGETETQARKSSRSDRLKSLSLKRTKTLLNIKQRPQQVFTLRIDLKQFTVTVRPKYDNWKYRELCVEPVKLCILLSKCFMMGS